MDTLEWHLSLLTNENITTSSTQEQELGYYWVMHLKNVGMVIKRDSLLLSLSLINRTQRWILGFQTVYLPLLFFFNFFFKFYFIFKFYIIVLVLPNIKMNPPQVYMCSPSWTLLPPHTIPLGCPSAPAPSIWPDYAAAVGFQPDLNTYIQDLRDIFKTKLRNFVFLTEKELCPSLKSKEDAFSWKLY